MAERIEGMAEFQHKSATNLLQIIESQVQFTASDVRFVEAVHYYLNAKISCAGLIILIRLLTGILHLQLQHRYVQQTVEILLLGFV